MRLLCALPFLCVALLGAEADPAHDASYFNKSVYPILQKAGCSGCHNPDGIASATRLRFPEADASADEVTRFGRSLYKLIDRNDVSNSLLLKSQPAASRTPEAFGSNPELPKKRLCSAGSATSPKFRRRTIRN